MSPKVLLIGGINRDQLKRYDCESIEDIAKHFSNNEIEVNVSDWKSISNNGTVDICYNENRNQFYENINVEEIADLIILRQLGKINDRLPQFKSFLDYLNNCPIPTINNPKTMIDNLSKEYLIRLQEEGFPTVWTQRFNINDYQHFVKQRDDFVVKPIYGGECGVGIEKLSKLSFEDAKNLEQKHGEMLIQEFVPEIQGGEYSLVYVGKRHSHAIHKPLVQEFKVNRVAEESKYFSYTPTNEEIELGFKIKKSWPSPFEVMRLDLVKTKNGPKIMEVELINPSIYDMVPGMKEKFSKNLYEIVQKYL